MFKASMLRPESSLRLIVVRHGETVGNSSIRYYGRTDVALSDLGRAQMRAAVGWLQTKFGCNYFEPVFTSPLARATESVRLIAGSSRVRKNLFAYEESFRTLRYNWLPSFSSPKAPG